MSTPQKIQIRPSVRDTICPQPPQLPILVRPIAEFVDNSIQSFLDYQERN